jgi:hypothetical protein
MEYWKITNLLDNFVHLRLCLTRAPKRAFVLGRGRAPIPAKLVKRIVTQEFIEMSELNPDNLSEPQSETAVFSIEASSIIPKPASTKKRDISDILTWVECFNSYTAVLTHFSPSRSRDLLAYMALIMFVIVLCGLIYTITTRPL